MTDFNKMRSNMVFGQLQPNGITSNRVLKAFTELQREFFVAENDQAIAYSECLLQVTPDRFLLNPLVLARLIQAAQLQPNNNVLDIAAATGYGPALLSYMVRSVVALEEDKGLLEQLLKNLDTIDTYSVSVVDRDLKAGVIEDGPYDVIFIEGAVEEIPPLLFDQLKEGGKFLTLEAQDVPGLAQGVMYQKIHHSLVKFPLFECEAAVIPAFKKSHEDFQF